MRLSFSTSATASATPAARPRVAVLVVCLVAAGAYAGNAWADGPPPVAVAIAADAATATAVPTVDAAALATGIAAESVGPVTAASVGADAPAAASQAVTAAVRAQPTNVNVSVRVGSAGDDGVVAQANAAVAAAADAPAAAPGGQYQSGDGQYQPPDQPTAAPTSSAISDSTPDLPGSAATSSSQQPSPADDTSTWTWNWSWDCQGLPTAAAPALTPDGDIPSIWIWNWTWNCGTQGGDDPVNSTGIDGQYQSPAIQYQPSNVNISVRINSPGDDGPVTQSNVAVAYPLSAGSTGMTQTSTQTLVILGQHASSPASGSVQFLGWVGDAVGPGPPDGVNVAVDFGEGQSVALGLLAATRPAGRAAPPSRAARARRHEKAPHPQTAGAAVPTWVAAPTRVVEQRSPHAGEHAAARPATRRGGGARRPVSRLPFHLPLQLGMDVGSVSGGGGSGSSSGPVAALLAAFGFALIELLRTYRLAVGARPLRLAGRRLERPG